MCIKIIIGPSDKELEAARWEAADALYQAIPSTQANQALKEQMSQARRQAASPQTWAQGLVRALTQASSQVQRQEEALGQQARELQNVRQRYEDLQQSVDWHIDQLVEAKMEQAEADKVRWLAEKEDLIERVEALEAALAAEQEAHREDVEKLEEKVAELKSLVVEQQQALDKLGQ